MYNVPTIHSIVHTNIIGGRRGGSTPTLARRMCEILFLSCTINNYVAILLYYAIRGSRYTLI